jgi:hypothetical protein
LTQIPVLVIGFNRPDFISSLFDRLKECGVTDLYVSLDGPRNESEKSICERTLLTVLSYSSDFHLTVLNRRQNLGCALGVVSALDWFFNEVEFGIVLEDDCVPDNSFFEFITETKLNVLTTEGNIVISGHNPFMQRNRDELSRYVLIHGWATWATVWKSVRTGYFQTSRPSFRNPLGEKRKAREAIFWWANASRARLGGVDTWDSIFAERVWFLGIKTLVPKENLISNVGFGAFGTHTRDSTLSNLLVNGDKFDELTIDQALFKGYFQIKLRHLVTPFARVFLDVIDFRKRKDFEKLLVVDRNTRLEVNSAESF